MPIDKSYLRQHGNTWRVQVAVPKHLRPIIGTSVLFASTKTDSLALANLRKHPLIHTLKGRIKAAEGELRKQGRGRPDPITTEALEWKAALAASDDGGPYDPVEAALSYRLDEIERTMGESQAGTLAAIARGQGTPISALVEDYLREKAFRPRQAHEYSRTIRGFEGWLREEAKLAGTVESVTRRVVADWRRDTLIRPGVHHKTANRAISSLSSFWRWLEMQGHVQGENPWRGMSLAKGKAASNPIGQPRSASSEKRAFTDPELVALLSAEDVSPLLRDGMRCALLTACRIEELFNIRVGDLRLNEPIPYLDLKGSKTDAARRTIPIHPDLMELVTRRTAGKAAEAWLFDDLREVPDGSIVERSQPVSKTFTRLRRRLAATVPSLDQRVPGARQADCDWHTFRRTFAMKARDALNGGAMGFSQWTIGQVMGHAGSEMPLPMTMGVYAGKEGLEAKAACVRAVRLPNLSSSQ
jgi:integrase